jgi:hypothetical protein
VNLAVVYAQQWKSGEAERLYVRSLAIRATGNASSLHNLALVEDELGRNKNDDSLGQRMVAMPVKDLLSALKDYADLLRRMKRPVEAERWINVGMHWQIIANKISGLRVKTQVFQ